MLSGEFFARVVRTVVGRPVAVLAVVGALALGGAVLAALQLRPSTAIDTLVDPGSQAYKDTQAAREAFGDDAVVILIEGDLASTLLTPDLGRLIDFEECLAASDRSEQMEQRPPVCAALSQLKPAKVVYGPGTFISRSVEELSAALAERADQAGSYAEEQAQQARELAEQEGLTPEEQDQAAEAARQAVNQNFSQQLIQTAIEYGITRPPAVNDPQFVAQLVFEEADPSLGPKARFSYLFPSSDAGLVQVRLRPDLTDAERRRAIDLIREAAASPRFAPARGSRMIVTGVPAVVDALADAVQSQLVVLLIAAVLVMAATLALVFRSPLRLLPLLLALAAAGITFGGLALLGAGLTMASVAALPVLIGLAVDYAIQFQSRFNEQVAGGPDDDAAEAAVGAARLGAPTIASAGLATVVGFLALLLSPVPMVRGFGLIVVGGVVVALACALTAGFAALARFGGARAAPQRVWPAPIERARETLARLSDPATAPGWWNRLLDARDAVTHRIARAWRTALSAVLGRPGRALGAGLVLAVLGWAADTQLRVVSDVRELVPQQLQALQDVNELERATGVSGELDVTIHAEDVTDPAVLSWMTEFQAEVLREHGYQDGETCSASPGSPELCPGLSLTDLLGTTTSREQIDALLAAVPPYFLQSILTSDRKTANLAFGIRLMPLERQQEVIEDVRSRLDPPPGVTAGLTGLPVLAAQGNAELSAPWRRLLVLGAGLAAVFLVLLAVRRSAREAAVPLIPIALATGWAGLILFVLGIPLNPMSAALGAVVIAISTEFSVLLSARYREERDTGVPPRVALERAYGSTGAAVLASGVTATAGFAVLLASDIQMLRDFGLVTVVGLGVSLLGVMLALPAALVWADRRLGNG